METLLSHCAALFSQNGGLFTMFFLGGITGGFTHCIGMCGALVAADSAMCGTKCGSCSKRSHLKESTGILYHLGRATTYGAFGFMAALLGKQIAALPFWHILVAVMLCLAGAMFLISSLPKSQHSLFQPSGKLTYLRGTMLGFMPCGLLYAALMMAATLANPLEGMVAMWLFTLGTVPAMLIASGGAALLSQKWQSIMHNVGRAMMAFNGISLLVIAARGVR